MDSMLSFSNPDGRGLRALQQALHAALSSAADAFGSELLRTTAESARRYFELKGRTTTRPRRRAELLPPGRRRLGQRSRRHSELAERIPERPKFRIGCGHAPVDER